MEEDRNFDENVVSTEPQHDEEQEDDAVASKVTILNAVAAELTKQVEGSDKKFVSRVGALWPLDNTDVTDFVNLVENKFIKKNKRHGYVQNGSTMGGLLDDYIVDFEENAAGFNGIFESFVSKVIKNIAFHANDLARGSLRGGSIVFVHYKKSAEVEDFGRFLIVMVDKKKGFDFTKDLLPTNLSSIDVDALRQAASFDLTLFSEVFHEQKKFSDDSDQQIESYLNFIDGKSTSDFFKSALGCGRNVDNNTCVNELERALKDFIEKVKPNRHQKKNLNKVFLDFIEDRAKSKKPIHLGDVQSELEKAEPELLKKNGVQKFSDFVNKNGYKVNHVFEATRNAAKDIAVYDISDEKKTYYCRVNKSSIGGARSRKPVKISENMEYFMIPIGDKLTRQEIIDILEAGEIEEPDSLE